MDKLLDAVTQVLGQLGLEEVDDAALRRKFEKVDVVGGDLEGIVGAVGAYLVDVADVAQEEADAVVEQGRQVLGGVLPSLGIVGPGQAPAVDGEVDGAAEKESKTVLIEDIKAWKASMPLSAGPRPVADLSEFEETGPKL